MDNKLWLRTSNNVRKREKFPATVILLVKDIADGSKQWGASLKMKYFCQQQLQSPLTPSCKVANK